MFDVEFIKTNLEHLTRSIEGRDPANIARYLKRIAYVCDPFADVEWKAIDAYIPPSDVDILVYGQIFRENNRSEDLEFGKAIVHTYDLDESDEGSYQGYEMPHDMQYSLKHADYYVTFVIPTHWALINDPLGTDNWSSLV